MTSQNQNPKTGQHPEASEGSRTRRTAYLLNIVFLSCLAIASLLFAIFVYLSTRIQGMGGHRQLYTQSQIDQVRREAAEEEKNNVFLQIQSSLENGRSTTQMLREVFDDSITVKNGDTFSFYPVQEDVKKNPLVSGGLLQENGEIRYISDGPGVDLHQGVLLSESNGRIDWSRLADSGIEEVVVTAGTVSGRGFEPDEQCERNCRYAGEKEIPLSICLEVTGTAEKEALSEAADAVRGIREGSGEDGERLTIILRLHMPGSFSGKEAEQKRWTDMVRLLCRDLEEAELAPVVGGDEGVFAAQIDLSSLDDYNRWLIDYEDAVFFPYSFLYWEYGTESGMRGVPGTSIKYVRLEAAGSLEIE